MRERSEARLVVSALRIDHGTSVGLVSGDGIATSVLGIHGESIDQFLRYGDSAVGPSAHSERNGRDTPVIAGLLVTENQLPVPFLREDRPPIDIRISRFDQLVLPEVKDIPGRFGGFRPLRSVVRLREEVFALGVGHVPVHRIAVEQGTGRIEQQSGPQGQSDTLRRTPQIGIRLRKRQIGRGFAALLRHPVHAFVPRIAVALAKREVVEIGDTLAQKDNRTVKPHQAEIVVGAQEPGFGRPFERLGGRQLGAASDVGDEIARFADAFVVGGIIRETGLILGAHGPRGVVPLGERSSREYAYAFVRRGGIMVGLAAGVGLVGDPAIYVHQVAERRIVTFEDILRCIRFVGLAVEVGVATCGGQHRENGCE